MFLTGTISPLARRAGAYQATRMPPSYAVKDWPRQGPAQPCQSLTNPVHCRW
jgi:hypothetical protein